MAKKKGLRGTFRKTTARERKTGLACFHAAHSLCSADRELDEVEEAAEANDIKATTRHLNHAIDSVAHAAVEAMKAEPSSYRRTYIKHHLKEFKDRAIKVELSEKKFDKEQVLIAVEELRSLNHDVWSSSIIACGLPEKEWEKW